MFTREKKRVDPARTNTKKGKKGKNSKAAWETLLSSSQNGTTAVGNARVPFGSVKRNGYPHVQWSDDDDDDDDDYDKYNTSITPSTSLNFSGSRSKSFETLWRSAAVDARANSSLSRSFESQSVPVQDFHMHTGQPPVPKEIVGQIREGKYVNFQELLPENLGKENAKNKMLIDDTERLEDITKWIDCMAAYVAIFTCGYPNRIRDLLAYQRIITRLYRECQDKKAWQRYDVAFRRKASRNGLKDWSTVDENLWIMASSRDARRAVLCKACLSLAHDQASCPLKPKEATSKTPRQRSWLSRSGSRSVKREEIHDEERPRSVSPTRGKRGPNEGLDLKFAFGYHGYNACNNLFYTQSNEIVFHVAALGIVYSPPSHQQRFYKSHTDDILCLTIHDELDLVATGQVGKQAETHVWDATSMRTVAVLKGFHKRGIICVDFSGDGKKLADVGLDDDHSICIWDWKKEQKIVSTRGHKDMIFVIEWNPFNPNYLVSVGEKHIKFWTQKDTKLEKRPVTFGKAGTAATMLCVCHSPTDDLCFTGSDTGLVYVWQGTTLRRSVQAHNGAVCAMYSLSQTKQQGYVTGGRDGVVTMWDPLFEQCHKAFKVEEASMNPGSVLLQNLPPVRSLHTDEGKILIGTGHDEVIEIGEDGKMTILVQGHGEGEVWGLDTHPTEDECMTVSDDKTLRVWDLAKLRLKKVKKLKKGGRAVTYSPDGLTVAVGQNDGGFLILDSISLEKVVGFKDRKEAISDIKFSPDGKFLAVGSHDNFVDIYSVRRGKRTGVCKGSSSYITHLDWDTRGKLIQTNSGAREHLFYEAPAGSRKTISGPDVERLQWSTFTSVLGPTVKGVFPPGSDVTDVNATCRTKDCNLLASGDDFGFVKLFEYPVSHRGTRGRQYGGHSSHVTNVRWTCDDRQLVSTGGLDTAVLIWDRLVVSEVEEPDKAMEEKVLVQPKFIPTGPIKNPIARGKAQWN